MKEAAAGTGNGGRGGGGGGGGERVRSVSDKERTKMRERQRRSITTNIFHGLRKHGGYPLSARADINEVLRHLANEAGWIVDSDGTTYRSSPTPSGFGCCPLCGGSRRSANSTPTSSVVLGGECSTTASPRRFQVGDSVFSGGGGGSGAPTSLFLAGGGGSGGGDVVTPERDIPLALYMYGGIHRFGTTGEPSTATVTYHHQQQLYLQKARASAQNTPLASPLRRS